VEFADAWRWHVRRQQHHGISDAIITAVAKLPKDARVVATAGCSDAYGAVSGVTRHIVGSVKFGALLGRSTERSEYVAYGI